ncbi:GNAT family N-acetyltransferase [Vibrio sp. 99-70-13A1]|nr:GNAT family N-acetyltransferase [Vibrio sp. 99-70-13A1]
MTKATLFPYINDTFGWDDNFQYQRLKNDYPLSWYHWIEYQNKRVGLLCFKPTNQSYHIHLLIVFPECQEQGLGSKIMAQVYDIAEREQCNSITLSSFKSNKKAIEFYRKLGYKITDDSDMDFVTMTLNIV